MRDKTRRFTVGIGYKPGHLRILAANEKTKTWANRHEEVVGFVLLSLKLELASKTVVRDREPWEPVAPSDCATPTTIAKRFEEMMVSGFPDDAFDIRVEPRRAP